MKSIEEVYPDYDWGEVNQDLVAACKALQIFGIVSVVTALAGGVLLLGSSPVTAILTFIGGVAGGLLVFVVARAALLLAGIAVDIRYSSNVALILEENTRKG